MPTDLTKALRTALIENNALIKEYSTVSNQQQKNQTRPQAISETIKENIQAMMALEEEKNQLDARIIQFNDRFDKEEYLYKTKEQFLDELSGLNQNSEQLAEKLKKLSEDNVALEQEIEQLNADNETVAKKIKQITQQKAQNKAKVEMLIETGRNYEQHGLLEQGIEHDFFVKEGEWARSYPLDLVQEPELFELLFEQFIETRQVNDAKKAEIFSDLLQRSGLHFEFLLAIYHANRNVFSLDKATEDWKWSIDNGAWSYTQPLAGAVLNNNMDKAITLLCYGANLDLIKITSGSPASACTGIEVAKFMDKKIKSTAYTDLFDSVLAMRSGVAHLVAGNKVEAVEHIARAIRLNPLFVARYLQTQVHFAVLQATEQLTEIDQQDYHFLLKLISIYTSICKSKTMDKAILDIILYDVLTPLEAYPVRDGYEEGGLVNLLLTSQDEATQQLSLFEELNDKSEFFKKNKVAKFYQLSEHLETKNSMRFFSVSEATEQASDGLDASEGARVNSSNSL